MTDVIDRTPGAPGLDRFTAELGDALELHARSLPAPGRRRGPRRPRRLVLATAAVGAAALALVLGLAGERAGSPTVASAAAVMRASADALGNDAGGPLRAGASWHTRVEVTMRHADAFQYTTTTRWETWQSRDGSGRERLSPSAPVGFPTGADRSAWLEAGSPDLAEPRFHRRLRPAARPFPFGIDALSYRQLQALPTDPRDLAKTLAGMAERQRGSIPAGFDAREARAYLLFTLLRDSFEAPTPSRLRAALYELMATAPGLELEGAVTDHAGRAGTAVAVVLGDARFVLIVAPRSGVLLETRRILLRKSAQFPGMTPGLISRATFLESGAAVRRGR